MPKISHLIGIISNGSYSQGKSLLRTLKNWTRNSQYLKLNQVVVYTESQFLSTGNNWRKVISRNTFTECKNALKGLFVKSCVSVLVTFPPDWSVKTCTESKSPQ